MKISFFLLYVVCGAIHARDDTESPPPPIHPSTHPRHNRRATIPNACRVYYNSAYLLTCPFACRRCLHHQQRRLSHGSSYCSMPPDIAWRMLTHQPNFPAVSVSGRCGSTKCDKMSKKKAVTMLLRCCKAASQHTLENTEAAKTKKRSERQLLRGYSACMLLEQDYLEQ